MRTVAILGTGPAGMMAAQACVITGVPFHLFAAPDRDGVVQPSFISGAQFMHVAVPTVSDEESPDFAITYRKTGTAQGYAEKVYTDGLDQHVPFVSFENVEDGQTVPAWSLRGIYENQWTGIAGSGSSVNAMKIDARILDEWVRNEQFDLIVSTIPRPALCRTHAGMDDRTPHAFWSQEVRIVNDEDMGVDLNVIAYNGDPDTSWYRSSNIAGWRSTEWAADRIAPYYVSRSKLIKKPVKHTCDCWADAPVVWAGRYGKWEKGVLVQDGFIEAFQAIESLRVKGSVR